MKPEWVIYKNNMRMGQAVTWHRALDVLVKQEGIKSFRVEVFQERVFVVSNNESYKLVKER